MSEKIGYIVQDKKGALLLETGRDLPEGGALFTGDYVTIFPTYGQARHAIKRTIKWYDSHSSPDSRWDFVRAFGKPIIKPVWSRDED